MMKIIIGFILGVCSTILAYEQDTATEMALEVVPEQFVSRLDEIDYTFYDNLPKSSITVIKDAYQAVLSETDLAPVDVDKDLYYVQIGAFSKQVNADSFRAQAILEGYLSADIFVQSSADVHRVMIGPFAKKHEAELAIDWASAKKFSGLLLAKKE